LPAPREIIDSYESILDVFTLNIKQRERVAFILCDNLVELACKTKAHQRNHHFNRVCGFHAAWNAPGVLLAPNGLGGRVQNRRDTRNTMQHGSAAVTVTPENCADAILDVRKVIDRLWRNTINRNLTLPYRVILSIVDLYASNGNEPQRQAFEDAMREGQWRGITNARKAKVSEVIVKAGLRTNWHLAIHQSPPNCGRDPGKLIGRSMKALRSHPFDRSFNGLGACFHLR